MPSVEARAVRYHQYGDPRKVLQLDRINVSTDLGPDEVLVRWLASPINPLDINLIEGTYAVRNKLPSVGGAEGVGQVEKVGSNVQNIRPGDHVLALGLSIWADFGIANVKELIKIRKDVDLISASQLTINPPTAYCILKVLFQAGTHPRFKQTSLFPANVAFPSKKSTTSFRLDACLLKLIELNDETAFLQFFGDLKPGDYVIQNAANSGVGRSIIQLANAFGFKTINLVRDRPNIEELRRELKSLGADYVLTEKEFAKEGRKLVTGKKIKLACNGVGGRSALAISAALVQNGICVTYGGMSKEPHQFSTGALVFKNLKAVGYANGPWLRDPRNLKERTQMFEELQNLIIAGKLKPTPVQTHRLENFAQAIERQIDGRYGKQMFIISEAVGNSPKI